MIDTDAVRSWTDPLVALAVEWSVLCAVAGPVLATAGIVVCVAAGVPFGEWLGRKLFGRGGT